MTISISDLFKIPVIYHMDLAKNGKFVLYSSNATGVPHLYVQPTRPDSTPAQITSGDDAVMFGFFAPKGDKVLYLQDKDGNELHHLFLMPREGGEAKRLTKTPYRTWGGDWHPDGKEVTRCCVTKKSCLLQTFDLETGEKIILKEQAAPFLSVKYSHDGEWLACSMMGGGKDPKNEQILVVKRNDPTDTIVYSIKDGSKETLPSWSPDDRKLAFLSDAMGRRQAVVQEFQGEEQIFLNLGKDEEAAEEEICWGPKSDRIYYVISKYSRTTVHEHPLDGERQPAFPFPRGTVSMLNVSEDGKTLVVVHSSMSSPQAIYLHEVGSASVTLLNPRKYEADLTELAQPRSVWYTSLDGLKIHGWYLPAGSGAAPHPAVVWPHGGPWWQVFDSWSPYLQSMSQSGFAVFAPNFRGSTGYGADFRNMDILDPGGGDLEDVVYAAKWLRGQPEIDASKIAIMGGSYGGFMTLIALTKKPEVFSAGVAIVPVVDWLEMFGLSDAGFRRFMRELFEGSPAEREKLYRDRSPTTHVDKIKAPVLIIHGRHDSRCPIQPVEKFVKKLKEMGHPHDFKVREKEGHGFARVKAHIEEVAAAVKFLRKTMS